MMKRLILCSLAIALIAAPAFAGNAPEFDTVECDANNIFNDWIKMAVIHANMAQSPYGDGYVRINAYSDWLHSPEWVNDVYVYEEFFTTAGMTFPDPCFAFRPYMAWVWDVEYQEGHWETWWDDDPYESALTDAYNAAEYRWRIILQMKPESDIDLNIVDCVVKHNEPYWEWAAEQTGRYRADWGQLFFVPSANPSITVKAIPGPYATPGFEDPFYMDARQLPGLELMCLDNALYTSKALWEEGIVMVMPETGVTNSCGETMFNLKQGDAIQVTVSVPGDNTCDIYYGEDNVVLKYIGIIGTYFVNADECWTGPPTPVPPYGP
jgi:hypothetical protein